MDELTWTVTASLAGIAVTAVLGAIAIVREQAPMRQLERVTAVLNDTPSDSSGRAALEAVRDLLAERVSLQYRAPRYLREQFSGWMMLLVGVGIVGTVYTSMVNAITHSLLLAEAVNKVPVWADIAAFALGVLFAGACLLTGARWLRARALRRLRWAAESQTRDTKAPKL